MDENNAMKFLVKDALIFMDIANALADKGNNEVFYFTNWQTGYPLFKDFCTGLDFEYLKKKNKHGNPLLFWEEVMKKDWDCVANFDVHNQDEIFALRQLFPNKSIWGAGRGEVLEADRIILKQWIETLGLPVNPYKVVKGVTALRSYIKENPNKYVKINIFRGDCESFCAKDIDYNRADFLKLEINLGAKAEDVLFIVEDPIDTEVEVGYDGFFNGHSYSDKCFLGVEYHKNLYIARVMDYDELPEPIYETLEAFSSLLEKMDYRGAISTEEKIVSFKEHYLIDVCSRLPSPLSALYPQFINNWAELVYKTGKKENCPLDIDVKYVGAFALESKRGEQEYLPISIKPSDRDKIKFQSACMVGDKYHSVKGNSIIATIVVGGDNPDECLEKIKEYSKLIDVPNLQYDDINGIDKIKEVLKKCKDVGISI